MDDERAPLLGRKASWRSVSSTYGSGREAARPSALTLSSSVRIGRHITLPHAIALMVGTVAGTGIFVSPTGVTKQVGSVGTTFIMWTVMGMFSLLLALCYAELGTALPLAGGDYAYIQYVLGKLPAFLCLWLMVVLIGPCAISVIGRTVAAYVNTLLDLQCSNSITILICIWLTAGAAALNCRSVKWSARLVTLFSAGKVIALGVIVVAGIVRLCQGYTSNLTDPFAYGVTDPGAIMLGFLPAFFTFAGWDCVNALAEEMVNPKRDLPIAAVVSLLLVTSVYLLVNVAYFTALNPLEFIESDAVAVLFAERVMPSVSFIIPMFVIFSAVGSTLNLFLACPRWAFAGGRDNAIPEILSYIHIKHLTPIPSIILTTVITFIFCMAIFFDVQDLLNITSIITQMKMSLSLIALIILKRREPNKSSTVTVHPLLVWASLIILIVFTVLPLWQTPLVACTSFIVFSIGFPLFYLKDYLATWPSCNAAVSSFTRLSQLVLEVVPASQPRHAFPGEDASLTKDI